jgi:hypothetical protein
MRAAAFTESKRMRKPSPVAVLLSEYETRQATQPPHRRLSVAQLGSVTRLTGRPHPFANLRGAPNANRPLPRRHGIAAITHRRTEAAAARSHAEVRRYLGGEVHNVANRMPRQHMGMEFYPLLGHLARALEHAPRSRQTRGPLP